MGQKEEELMSAGQTVPTTRVAAGQFGSIPGEVDKNTIRTLEAMSEAHRAGVELLVMPECGLTGYVFETAEQARAAAIDIEGAELRLIAKAAADMSMHVVVGFLELEGDVLRNTAMLLGPGGLTAIYRKTHLPHLGADRFVTPGDNEPVLVETPFGIIGLSICYDLRFPEWARCLALGGADIIANPTNWPAPAERVAELFTRVRAAENHVYVIAANRGDEERGAQFIGRSQVIDPTGSVLASVEREEGLIVADIQPTSARMKDVRVPEVDFAISLFGDRRPHLYGAISSTRTQTGRRADGVDERN
jgi:predicted amidohydrolase